MSEEEDGPVLINVRVSANPMPGDFFSRLDFFSRFETEPKSMARTLKLSGAPSAEEGGDGTRIRASILVLDKENSPFNLTISGERGRNCRINVKPPSGSSSGAAIGIVIGVLVVIVAAGLAGGFYWKRRKEEEEERLRRGFRVRVDSVLPASGRRASLFAPLSGR